MKRIGTGMDAWRAVEEVEGMRGAKSLDGLSKMIVERRKGGKRRAGVGGGPGGGGGGGNSQGQEEDGDEDDGVGPW